MGFCPNSTLSRPARKVWDLCVLCYLLYKLTLAAKAAFIHKILCFEVFVILFGQLVERMLKNNSQFKNTLAPPPGEYPPLWCILIFLALPVKKDPLPNELKFRETTARGLKAVNNLFSIVELQIIYWNPKLLSENFYLMHARSRMWTNFLSLPEGKFLN